jgi:hypothetical protein
MQLLNFKLAKDNIALEQGEAYFDLHNCFSFVGLEYCTSTRELTLKWAKAEGSWVSVSPPAKLKILLKGVYLFKVQERDSTLPFTEDDCLSSIGFIWNDLTNEMGGFFSHIPNERCAHLSLAFMSGFSIKVGAESAFLESWLIA